MKKIPMLERFAVQSLVEYEGELIFSKEKFAELIVRECSKVIRHSGQRKGAFGNEDLRPSELATMIEEHFGVED